METNQLICFENQLTGYYMVSRKMLRGDTNMTSTLRGVGKKKNEILSGLGGGGLTSVLDVQSLFS